MCSQTQERAEVVAENSAVKQALASIEECEQLGPGNQITVLSLFPLSLCAEAC